MWSRGPQTLHGEDHFSRGHFTTFTLPVPEMPAPGTLQAGRKILIPVEQGGLKNRYCAGGPGSQAGPGGAPWGKVFGIHLVGSDAALPPKVAAFFAPVCGKAETGKNKIKRRNRGRQRTVRGRQPCRASGLYAAACLSFPTCNVRSHVVQTDLMSSPPCWAPGGVGKGMHVRKGSWLHTPATCRRCAVQRRAAGPSEGAVGVRAWDGRAGTL